MRLLLKCEIVLKDVPSSGTKVDMEELQQEAILDLKYEKIILQAELQ